MITDETILQVAKFARLEITDLTSHKKDFEEILHLFSVLDELDLSEEVNLLPIQVDTKMRDDISIDGKYKEKALLLDTQHDEDYFKGPKAL